MNTCSEVVFEEKLQKLIEEIRTILDNGKFPKVPGDVQHRYVDKFFLAEFLTTSAIASSLNVLEALGLTGDGLRSLIEWSQDKTISMRFTSTEKCEFNREISKKTKSDTIERSGFGGKTKETVVTTIPKYVWTFESEYELFAFPDVSVNRKIVLQSRRATCEIFTSTKVSPLPSVVVRNPMDINISWLFTHVNLKKQIQFGINRDHRSCRTPRRNPEIDASIDHFMNFQLWCADVNYYFDSVLFPNQNNRHDFDIKAINCKNVFVPIIPLFNEVQSDEEEGMERINTENTKKEIKNYKLASEKTIMSQNSSHLIATSFIEPFLAHELRTLGEKFAEIEKVLPKENLITLAEGRLLVCLQHAIEISQEFSNGIYYLENMLRQQIIKSIGKKVTSSDFSDYMKFHCRKIFKEEFAPKEFIYVIRQHNHFSRWGFFN